MDRIERIDRFARIEIIIFLFILIQYIIIHLEISTKNLFVEQPKLDTFNLTNNFIGQIEFIDNWILPIPERIQLA